MPGLSGTEIKAAFTKGAIWNVPAICGANNGILIKPTNIIRDAPIDTDDSLGQYFSLDGLPGPIKIEYELPFDLRYDSLDALLAQYMGIAGNPAQQGATAAYTYTYKFKTDIDGLFGTFIKNMKGYIEEYPSTKVASLNLKGESGGVLQGSADIIASNKNINPTLSAPVIATIAVGTNPRGVAVEAGRAYVCNYGSSNVSVLVYQTNSTQTFASVTNFEQLNRIRYSEGVFRMNNQSAGALTDANKIYPMSFEISSKRNLAGEYTGQYKTYFPNTQDLIDEPTNNGMIETTLKVTFPRHTNKAYLEDLISNVYKKLDMTFTGAVIEGVYYRQFRVSFPSLQLKNVDVLDAQGNIKEPLEFIVHGCAVAPAGMTGLTDPFWISGINRRSTDPLA